MTYINLSFIDMFQEDDLADEIAECILTSSVGLALLSVDPDTKLNKKRYLCLKDRLSSKALQATLRVFRIQPPSLGEQDEPGMILDTYTLCYLFFSLF